MDGRATRILVWVALALAAVMAALYPGAIRAQGELPPERFTIYFVAAWLVLMPALLGLSLPARVPRPVRAALRAAAAGGLIVIGFLALFSIGLPLFVAGLLAAAAAVITASKIRSVSVVYAPAAALVAVAVLIAGFEVTERMIICPDYGITSGGGTGFVTGPYHYECVDGTLFWSSG